MYINWKLIELFTLLNIDALAEKETPTKIAHITCICSERWEYKIKDVFGSGRNMYISSHMFAYVFYTYMCEIFIRSLWNLNTFKSIYINKTL